MRRALGVLLLTALAALHPTVGWAAIAQTGTIQTVASVVNTDSADVTVPAGASLAVVLWSGYNNAALTMSTISLGGNAMTVPAGCNGAGSTTSNARGGAYLINPPSGTQPLAWDWSGAPDLTEGSPFAVVFFTGTHATAPTRDCDTVYMGGGGTISVTIDSSATDYVIGAAFSFGATSVGAPAGSGQTVDLNDFTATSMAVDVAHEDTPGASSTTFSGTVDGSVVALSLIESAGGGAAAAPPGLLLLGVGN